MQDHLSSELIGLLGEAAFVALTERFGGTRLHVPRSIGPEHELAQALGQEAADRLARSYTSATLRIPLARELRARHYRAQGLSNAQIARKLGITETGVDKLFRRMASPPVKGSAQYLLPL
jgi:hypothetical protein